MEPTGTSVLVIEDNPQNMLLICGVLGSAGYHVWQANRGMQGWKLAQEHRPDLILLDIQLPDVSGLEIVKWLRDSEELNSTPVIAVTAFAMVGDKEKMLSAGCDAYISKPYSVRDLLEVLNLYVPLSTNTNTVKTSRAAS